MNAAAPRNIENIKQKLQEAVTLAKTTIKPPADVITINGGIKTDYVTVEDVTIGKEHWLYIFGSGEDKKRDVLFKNKKGKFRTIIFIGFYGSKIYIKEKMLKITFLYCEDCQISIRGGTIGPVEFIKCKNSNIDIRDPPGVLIDVYSSIPIIQIDMPEEIHFYQRCSDIVYAVCGCSGITGVIIEENKQIKQTPMQTSMFGEQTFLLFSKTEGIVQIQERHALNNISQHLMFHDVGGEGDDVGDKKDDSNSGTFAFSPV